MSLLVLMLVAAAEPAPLALVTAYQSIGTEPAMVQGLATRLRTASNERGLALVDAAEAAKLQRSAVMCGEDVECLSTLGARAKAKWVVAFGIARVGGSWLFSALLIDVTAGKRAAMFSKSVPAKELDEAALIQSATTELFRGVVLVPRPAPVVLVPPKPAPVVEPWIPKVEAPPPPAHRLRPAAAVTTGLTVALGVATAVMAVIAQGHHRQLAATPFDLRPAADAEQRSLNLTTDVLLGASVGMGLTAGTLWIVDARSR